MECNIPFTLEDVGWFLFHTRASNETETCVLVEKLVWLSLRSSLVGVLDKFFAQEGHVIIETLKTKLLGKFPVTQLNYELALKIALRNRFKQEPVMFSRFLTLISYYRMP